MFHSEPDRFHQTSTGGGSVAGVYIDVSAPEAFWTVVGVAVSFDGNTTMGAGKVFNVALEFFVHWSTRILPWLIRFNVRFKLGDAEAARSKSQWSRTNWLKRVLYP